MKSEHFDPVRAWWNDRRELTVDGFSKSKKYTVAQLTEELGYNLDQCGFTHEEEETDGSDILIPAADSRMRKRKSSTRWT